MANTEFLFGKANKGKTNAPRESGSFVFKLVELGFQVNIPDLFLPD